MAGFNSLHFGYAVLAFAPYDMRVLPTLDLLRHMESRLHYRVSLDNVGQATLGEAKSAGPALVERGGAWTRSPPIAAGMWTSRGASMNSAAGTAVLFSNKAGQRVRLPVDFRSAS